MQSKNIFYKFDEKNSNLCFHNKFISGSYDLDQMVLIHWCFGSIVDFPNLFLATRDKKTSSFPDEISLYIYV